MSDSPSERGGTQRRLNGGIQTLCVLVTAILSFLVPGAAHAGAVDDVADDSVKAVLAAPLDDHLVIDVDPMHTPKPSRSQ